MKKQNINNLLNHIEKLSHIRGVKFSYCLVKNKKMLIEELDNIKKSLRVLDKIQAEEFDKYNKERIIIAKKHADKDTDEKPIIINDNYKISDMISFNKEFEKLKEKYKEIVAITSEFDNENNKLLDEDVGIDFNKIKLSDLPDELSQSQIEPIIDFIIEE